MKAMTKSALATMVLFMSLVLVAAGADQDPFKESEMKNKAKTGYAPVNGLKIYYEQSKK